MFVHSTTCLAASVMQEQRQVLETLAKTEVFFPIALAIIGALILLFGFKAYKAVVVFNCIALGFWVGGLLGARAQVQLVAAVIGAVLMGVIAWPMMKYAVSLSGGLMGAIVGMVIWRYFDLPAGEAWAGGLMGLILLGMLSFMLFKTSVILFSCIQGAAMVVLGASAVLIKCTPWSGSLQESLNNKPILLPLLVGSIAILGLVFQQQKHGLLGHEAKGSGGSSSSSSSSSSTKAEKGK